VLSLIAYSKCLLIGLKKWFLVEKALYEHVDVLLPLAINGIADDAVRRWKGCKELLEHLILVESIFHPRVNSFDMSNEALHLGLGVLDGSVFGHAVVDQFL
jgi:hypothetical protein